mmetsp:Transcript_35642/g.80527  ORF Transcript_35642/g.80527 Transcript_35642/m.80527 type:complete len:202 (+) Transcript_35642:148-753(+)
MVSAMFFHFSRVSSQFHLFQFACSSFFRSSSFLSSSTFCFFAAISIVCTESGAKMSPALRFCVYLRSFCSVTWRVFSRMSSRMQLAVNTPGLNFSMMMMVFRIPLTSDQKILRSSEASGLMICLTTRPVFQMKLSSSLRVGVCPVLTPASICSTLVSNSLMRSSKNWSFFSLLATMAGTARAPLRGLRFRQVTAAPSGRAA